MDAHFSSIAEGTFMENSFSPNAGSTSAELQVAISDLPARVAMVEAVPDDPLRVRERQALLILNEMHQFVALLDTQGNELETNQTSLDAVGLRRARSASDALSRKYTCA